MACRRFGAKAFLKAMMTKTYAACKENELIVVNIWGPGMGIIMFQTSQMFP